MRRGTEDKTYANEMLGLIEDRLPHLQRIELKIDALLEIFPGAAKRYNEALERIGRDLAADKALGDFLNKP